MTFPMNDPVQVPGPVGHGSRGVVGEADWLALLLDGQARWPASRLPAVVVVEHFPQGDDFQRLEDARPFGESQEDIGFGFRGSSDHGESRWMAWPGHYVTSPMREIASPWYGLLSQCGRFGPLSSTNSMRMGSNAPKLARF